MKDLYLWAITDKLWFWGSCFIYILCIFWLFSLCVHLIGVLLWLLEYIHKYIHVPVCCMIHCFIQCSLSYIVHLHVNFTTSDFHCFVSSFLFCFFWVFFLVLEWFWALCYTLFSKVYFCSFFYKVVDSFVHKLRFYSILNCFIFTNFLYFIACHIYFINMSHKKVFLCSF